MCMGAPRVAKYATGQGLRCLRIDRDVYEHLLDSPRIQGAPRISFGIEGLCDGCARVSRWAPQRNVTANITLNNAVFQGIATTTLNDMVSLGALQAVRNIDELQTWPSRVSKP